MDILIFISIKTIIIQKTKAHARLSLKSSTMMISLRSLLGDILMTEWTVRKRVEKPSLWKTMMTLAVGRLSSG